MTPPHSSSSDSSAIIGIDVGSTSVRAIAFDVTGHRLAVGSRPTPLRRLETGGEYDPDALFAAAVDALSDVSSELNGRPVAGIAATSIGESCVLVDEAGRSLAPSIAWYDKRTLPQTQSIERALGRERIFEITGHAAEPIFTLTKLLWMREHWPDALTGARRVLMIADWIAFRLCGVMASEPMLASRTLYFDIRDRCWSGELLALAGLNDRLPAPLKPSGTALGPLRSEVLSQTGLAGKPVVGVGGHDHIVGAMVAGLLGEGLVVDSAGTAEGLMTAAPSPLMDPDTIRRGYVQGAIETDRRFSYVVGGIFSSGGAMEWLRSVLGDPSQQGLIAEASKIPPGRHGVVFLPHLVNSPPPEPDPSARGAFVGITPTVTPAALYRAVLEGLALQSRMLLDGMCSLTGVSPVNHIRLIGGVTRNYLFVSIKANAFGRPVGAIDEPETTALGAALLAGVAAGIYPTFDAAVGGLRLKERIVEPDSDSRFYDELRTTVFSSLHERLRPINERLDRLFALRQSS